MLEKLKVLLNDNGKLFLTTVAWAASIDHIYLFRSVEEIRDLLEKYFNIEEELALTVFENKNIHDQDTAINYAAILTKK